MVAIVNAIVFVFVVVLVLDVGAGCWRWRWMLALVLDRFAHCFLHRKLCTQSLPRSTSSPKEKHDSFAHKACPELDTQAATLLGHLPEEMRGPPCDAARLAPGGFRTPRDAARLAPCGFRKVA